MTTGNPRAGLAAPQAIERVFDAPLEAVWRAWTDPDHLAQWWLPDGVETRHFDIALGADGQLRFRLDSPEEEEWRTGGVFYEIDPPSRLVYGDLPIDEHKNRDSAVDRSEGPEGTVTSVVFEDLGDGRTKVTLW
jgi:uncharacterized protein YndB with AHSA1/START domain